MNQIIIFFANYLYIVVIVIAIGSLLVPGSESRKNVLKVLLLALPISFIIAKIFGAIFYNPRPFVVEHIQPLIPHAANNGFPSDHTLLTMTIASIVFTYNRKLGIFLGTLALIVGLARVAAHVHHPIDILGGIVIAITSITLSLCILTKAKALFNL